MTTLKVMPDLPIELVRFNNKDSDQIIFDERYFIKKIVTKESNTKILTSICELNIEGFNNHKKIFTDESGQYLYLISAYLDEDGYKDTFKTIQTMSPKEIIILFKIMLERLMLAHQNDFNPYDIEYSNFLLDKDNKPVFTDFNCSFYKGECTYISSSLKHGKSKEWLITYDKMEILKLFLKSISSSFDKDIYYDENLYEILKYLFIKLKVKYILPQEVDEYLSDLIFKKMVPKEDDYFIEHLIDPLEKGLELKL